MDQEILNKWKVDRSLNVPLFRQLANNISFNISLGNLPHNHKLPPVKQLASAMGLSVDTVRAAYKLLEEEGLVITRPHHGTEILGLLKKETAPVSAASPCVSSFETIIDSCLEKGMTIAEIEAGFFNALKNARLPHVASYLLVECNEYDRNFCDQLSQHFNTSFDFLHLSEMENIRSRLQSGELHYKAVVTTYFHYNDVFRFFTPYNIPVYGVVIDIHDGTRSQVISLPPFAKVGILCQDIHDHLRLSEVIRTIRSDLEIRAARTDMEQEYHDIILWADALIVTHPCEEDAYRLRPNCPVYFLYDKINEQSLNLLRQNLGIE